MTVSLAVSRLAQPLKYCLQALRPLCCNALRAVHCTGAAACIGFVSILVVAAGTGCASVLVAADALHSASPIAADCLLCCVATAGCAAGSQVDGSAATAEAVEIAAANTQVQN